MTVNGWLQILAFCAALVILSPFLGRYMAKVYSGERVFLTPLFGVVFGSTLLDDPISWRFAFGGGLVLLGILIVMLRRLLQR